MNSGDWIGVAFILPVIIAGIWDLVAHISGRKTFSANVVRRSKEKRWQAWIWLLFTFIPIALGIWLIWHWELLKILFDINWYEK